MTFQPPREARPTRRGRSSRRPRDDRARVVDAGKADLVREHTSNDAPEGLDGLVASGIPGAILIVRNGNHTVRLTSGLGDIAHKTPMSARDHFKIASLTKTYVATVVLQLVGEGKLNLSDSVEQWLPGLVPNGKNITLRQLLNHVSGIADFESDPRYLKPYLSGNLGYYWAPRQLVKMAVSHKPLFPPGVTHTPLTRTRTTFCWAS